MVIRDVKLVVSQLTHELLLCEYASDGTTLKNKRIMTWETMRAAVQYLNANAMKEVEVWMGAEKYLLQLSKLEGSPPLLRG